MWGHSGYSELGGVIQVILMIGFIVPVNEMNVGVDNSMYLLFRNLEQIERFFT